MATITKSLFPVIVFTITLICVQTLPMADSVECKPSCNTVCDYMLNIAGQQSFDTTANEWPGKPTKLTLTNLHNDPTVDVIDKFLISFEPPRDSSARDVKGFSVELFIVDFQFKLTFLLNLTKTIMDLSSVEAYTLKCETKMKFKAINVTVYSIPRPSKPNYDDPVSKSLYFEESSSSDSYCKRNMPTVNYTTEKQTVIVSLSNMPINVEYTVKLYRYNTLDGTETKTQWYKEPSSKNKTVAVFTDVKENETYDITIEILDDQKCLYQTLPFLLPFCDTSGVTAMSVQGNVTIKAAKKPVSDTYPVILYKNKTEVARKNMTRNQDTVLFSGIKESGDYSAVVVKSANCRVPVNIFVQILPGKPYTTGPVNTENLPSWIVVIIVFTLIIMVVAITVLVVITHRHSGEACQKLKKVFKCQSRENSSCNISAIVNNFSSSESRNNHVAMVPVVDSQDSKDTIKFREENTDKLEMAYTDLKGQSPGSSMMPLIIDKEKNAERWNDLLNSENPHQNNDETHQSGKGEATSDKGSENLDKKSDSEGERIVPGRSDNDEKAKKLPSFVIDPDQISDLPPDSVVRVFNHGETLYVMRNDIPNLKPYYHYEVIHGEVVLFPVQTQGLIGPVNPQAVGNKPGIVDEVVNASFTRVSETPSSIIESDISLLNHDSSSSFS